MSDDKQQRKRRWGRRAGNALDAVDVASTLGEGGCAGLVFGVVAGVFALLGAVFLRNRK